MPLRLVSTQVPLIYCSKQPGKLLFFQKAVTIRTIDLAQNITRNWEAYGWDQLNIEAISLPHLRLEVMYKKGLYYREFMVYVAVKTMKDFYLSTYLSIPELSLSWSTDLHNCHWGQKCQYSPWTISTNNLVHKYVVCYCLCSYWFTNYHIPGDPF